FARLEKTIAAFPRGAELHERMIKACMAAGRVVEAAQAAERFADAVPHPKTFLRAAAIHAHLQQTESAKQLLAKGLELLPDSSDRQTAQAQLATSPALSKAQHA